MSSDRSRYAIHAAAREGKVTVVESLLNDDSGWTPLMIAASVKDGDAVVELLLSRGADVNQKNNNGQTALHFVASKNNLEVARKLLDHKPPASTRVRDKRGQYPLHRAAAVGSVPMVNLLLQNRSPLNATDNAGYTALHHAVAEGHGQFSRIPSKLRSNETADKKLGATAVALLKAGAETDKRDSDGFLALDLAPDKEVRKYIEREAENEGIDL
ncbi:ankyrin repeat-containing domain protein [Hypoxylon sp. FL0543]|nr:ankyrin repeat-containing domain protein [Hypoxylon sp. FL0543]